MSPRERHSVERPVLKRYADLREGDFASHPIWLNVHGNDEAEPWYGETDEVTYRPWDRPLPYDCRDPAAPMVVVRADLRFADGTAAVGCLTPMVTPDGAAAPPSRTQPQVFVPGGGGVVNFYAAVRRLALREQQRLHEWLRRDSAVIFPLRYTVSAGLVTPHLAGELRGFYYREGSRVEMI